MEAIKILFVRSIVEMGSLDRVGLVELGPVCEVSVDLVQVGGARLH